MNSKEIADACDKVRGEYVRVLESSETDDATAEIVRHQLMSLRDVQRNLEAVISGGKLELFRQEQDEKRKKSPLRFFR